MIRVLATTGARGLTHRAVDAAAEVPQGTTSRYFRSRDALLIAAAERVLQLHLARMSEHDSPQLTPDELEDAVVRTLKRASDDDVSLALFELHLEARRRPHLRRALAETTRIRQQVVLDLSAAAGLRVSDEDALLTVMVVNGILMTGLTATPELLRATDALIPRAVRIVLHADGARPDSSM